MGKSSNITKRQFEMAKNGIVSDAHIEAEKVKVENEAHRERRRNAIIDFQQEQAERTTATELKRLRQTIANKANENAELKRKIDQQARQINDMSRGHENIKQAWFELTGKKWNSQDWAKRGVT